MYGLQLHIVDVGNGSTTVLEYKETEKSGSKYYLYDAGSENLSPNLIDTLDSLGITTTNGRKYFTLAGMILSPTYKYLGLQRLLENYDFASFDLLTNFHSNHLEGNEIDVDKHAKFGSNSYMERVFEIPFCLLYSSAHPLTEFKIEKRKNLIKEKDFLENAFEKFKKPCILQIDNANGKSDFPQIFLSGNTPVDQMVLKEYTFCVFQIPHHKQRPKLATKIHNSFPSQELKENAAKLMALYNYRHTLGALINLLEDNHPLYEKAKSFNSYFMKKESGFENKFEKGFIKLFLTHTRLPNDPDDCYVMDNPQISLYEKSGGELFSDKVVKEIEEERKRQLDQIVFISECVEWAYYYKEISAELYVISAGDDYNKVALQAIIGIMIACEWKGIPCKFAFTNSGWLNYLGGLMPRVLREYVSANTQIWFLNDVCGAKGRLKNKSFFTVDLCSRSNAEDEGDSDKDQHPKIKVVTSSRTVEVRGMSVFKLEDIRNEEDHRNTGSRVSASLKVILSRHPLKHSDRITDNPCFLTDYLKNIGYPNPSKPIEMENVMKCIIGDMLVSQMMNLHKGQSEYLAIIPELLKCKTKGTSEFILNFTKTASISANVIVYISHNTSLEISNKKLLNARFEVINAKTTSLKITMHLTFAGKQCVSLDLVEHLNLNGSIGITLAEYIANYNYTGIVWKPAKCLSIGEVLHVLFKEDYVVSILKSIPLGFSAKVSLCKIQHYLSYIKLDDENRVEEAHIHMESPGPVANVDVCFDIKLISLHLYPLRAVIENSVQVKGMGLINGFKVEFNTCLSSYLSQDIDVKFYDSLATERAFEILNLKINEDVVKEHLKDSNCTAHLILSQTVPHSMAIEVTFLAFGVDPDSLKNHPLPPQFSDVTNADSYLGLHFPFRNKTSNSVVSEIPNPVVSEISNPVVCEKKNFAFNPLSTSTIMLLPEDIFNCSLCTESKEKLVADILPFHGCQKCLNGKVLLEVVESLCKTDGMLVENMLKIPPMRMEQNLSKLSLSKLKLSFIDFKVDSATLDLSVEKLELLSMPCLTLHNSSLKVAYSTQDGFTFEFHGKLTLQLHLHERLHTYTFNAELIPPTETSKGTLYFDNYNNFTLENLMEAFGWVPDKGKAIPILSSALAIAVRNVHIEFSPVSGAESLQVSSLCVMVYLQELDICILKLSHIQLEIKLIWQKDHKEDKEAKFKIYFKLQALISANLFVELEC